MADRLYRYDERSFRRGDPIPPGRWGQGLLEAGPTSRLFAREATFEVVRGIEFPEQPSRLRSAFAFGSLAATVANAHEMVQPEEPGVLAHDTPTLFVYEVRWPSGTRVARCDIGWTRTQMGPIAVAQQDWLVLARRYWRGEETAGTEWEHFAEHPLIVRSVVRRVDRELSGRPRG